MTFYFNFRYNPNGFVGVSIFIIGTAMPLIFMLLYLFTNHILFKYWLLLYIAPTAALMWIFCLYGNIIFAYSVVIAGFDCKIPINKISCELARSAFDTNFPDGTYHAILLLKVNEKNPLDTEKLNSIMKDNDIPSYGL